MWTPPKGLRADRIYRCRISFSSRRHCTKPILSSSIQLIYQPIRVISNSIWYLLVWLVSMAARIHANRRFQSPNRLVFSTFLSILFNRRFFIRNFNSNVLSFKYIYYTHVFKLKISCYGYKNVISRLFWSYIRIKREYI